MTKLKVLGASIAMVLLVASPAVATHNGGFNVESQFFGNDSVQFGGAGGGFNGNFDNDFDNDFDEDVFDN